MSSAVVLKVLLLVAGLLALTAGELDFAPQFPSVFVRAMLSAALLCCSHAVPANCRAPTSVRCALDVVHRYSLLSFRAHGTA